MNDAADSLSEQTTEARKQYQLAELQLKAAELRFKAADLSSQLPYSRGYPPVESPRKYGDFEDVKDEDRGEIEGVLGIIDRSELLLCELPTARPAAVVGTWQPEQRITPKAAPKRSPGKRYHASHKRHARHYLIDHPMASGKDVCAYFDEHGIRAPKSWYVEGTRELSDSYRRDHKVRARVDSMVSKVRRDLRS